jgi:hypothetical protein
VPGDVGELISEGVIAVIAVSEISEIVTDDSGESSQGPALGGWRSESDSPSCSKVSSMSSSSRVSARSELVIASDSDSVSEADSCPLGAVDHLASGGFLHVIRVVPLQSGARLAANLEILQ